MKLKNSLVGHLKQRDSLKRLFQKNKLPSALLFAGPAGIGKGIVAEEIARSLLCEGEKPVFGGCGICHSCHLIDVGNHPDFYRVDCTDRERYGVDGIKELLYSLNLKSFSTKGRVILLNDADCLQAASANSLLKSLEEPRPNTWFILTASNPSKLPSTILSRSQVWHYNSLPQAEVYEILSKTNTTELPKNITLEDMSVLADGCPGTISEVQEHFGDWVTAKESLVAIYCGDVSKAIDFATSLGKDKDTLKGKLKLLRIYTRSRMHEQPDDPKWAHSLLNLISAERLIFERNLSAATVLSAVFLNLVSDGKLNSFTTLGNSATLLEQLVV